MKIQFSRWKELLQPSRNPVLRAESRRLLHILPRSWRGWILILGAVAYLILWLFVYYDKIEPWQQKDSCGLVSLAFTAFHLWIYLLPWALILPSWRRRWRDGRFQDWLQTSITRAELLWGFTLPRCILILAIIYLFYIPMWPWNEAWLLIFPSEGFLDRDMRYFWPGRLHFLLTNLYFASQILFNAILVVWLILRSKCLIRASILYPILSAGFDIAAYALAYVPLHYIKGIPDQPNTIAEGLFSYPWFLATLLFLHGGAIFAAIFYLLKWTFLGFMLRDISRRIPQTRWFRGGEAGM